MTSSKDDTVALWLHNKLASPTHLWSFSSTIVSQYTVEKLQSIRDCFAALDSIVKFKFFLSLFHIPKRNYEEFKPIVLEIIEYTIQTCFDQWVLSIAMFVKTYWNTQSLDTQTEYELESFREAFNDLKRILKECVESDSGCERSRFLLPIEFDYLNKEARINSLPNNSTFSNEFLYSLSTQENTLFKKHFNLVKPNKSAGALEDLKSKASHYSKSKTTKSLTANTGLNSFSDYTESLNTAAQSGYSSLSSTSKSVPYVNRYMTSKKMESITSLANSSLVNNNGLLNSSDSYSSKIFSNTLNSGSSSFFKRSMFNTASTTITGKSTVKRDVGIKLLDVQEQSASPKEAKRKRKEQEKETQKKLKLEQQQKQQSIQEELDVSKQVKTTNENKEVDCGEQSVQEKNSQEEMDEAKMPKISAEFTNETANAVDSLGGGVEPRLSLPHQPLILTPQQFSANFYQNRNDNLMFAQPVKNHNTYNNNSVIGQSGGGGGGGADPFNYSAEMKTPISYSTRTDDDDYAPVKLETFSTNQAKANYSPINIDPFNQQHLQHQLQLQQQLHLQQQQQQQLIYNQQVMQQQQQLQQQQLQQQQLQQQQQQQQQQHQHIQPPLMQPAQLAQPQAQIQSHLSLSLTREQMMQAQEMFSNSNKLTRSEKALILGFIAGSRENPRPEHGSLITIKLNENEELFNPNNGEPAQRVLSELYFQMNYETGEYKKIKKIKPIV